MSVPKSMSRADIQAWGAEQASAEFGDTSKAKLACGALEVGLDFANRVPIGWNVEYGEKEFAQRCHKYISANYKPKPSGFLPAIGLTWLFWQMISALINWAVHKLIDVYYPKNTETPKD